MVAARMRCPSGDNSSLWKGGLKAAYARKRKVCKEEIAAYSKEWRSNNPEKVKAKNAIAYLVRKGKLPKLPPGEHRHHDDYDKQKDVRILSCSDHVLLHLELRRNVIG